MVSEGLVYENKHPNADLFIYNYSPKVQYDKLWNEITLNTRGLILDDQKKIISRPFGKFFNIEEHPAADLPMLPFDVFEKLDGSLGILYWINDTPFIATRGSFTSDQAIHATNLLHDKYSHTFEKFQKNKTYLFEIIYPENRIVVDYGKTDDLFLLTIIDNASGAETIEDLGFPTVKKLDGINDFFPLRDIAQDNAEGFVVRFSNNFRVKMKFAEYVRLHRILTGVSNISVWEYMKEGKPMNELLERVPDEFFNWLKQTQENIQCNYNGIESKSKSIYGSIVNSLPQFAPFKERQKLFAIEVMNKHKDISSILFNIYNNKKTDSIIWKMCRPVWSKPFKTEI